MNIFTSDLKTPYGIICLASNKKGLLKILLPSENIKDSQTAFQELYPNCHVILNEQNHADAALQLNDYFKGKTKSFNCKLDIQGTEFQKKIWKEVCKIPYGETSSYSNIAIDAGASKAARAAGRANHENPLPIIIPCHRVIGKNGSLTGYGGGLALKQKLLELEKEVLKKYD